MGLMMMWLICRQHPFSVLIVFPCHVPFIVILQWLHEAFMEVGGGWGLWLGGAPGLINLLLDLTVTFLENFLLYKSYWCNMMPNYALFLINNFFLNLIFLAFWVVVFSREPNCSPQIAHGKTSSYWLGGWLLPTHRSSWMRKSRVIQDVWMTCVEGESPQWWVSSGGLGQWNENFGNSYICGSAISMLRWLASRTCKLSRHL